MSRRRILAGSALALGVAVSTACSAILGIDDVTVTPDGSTDGSSNVGDVATPDSGPIDGGAPLPGCEALDGSAYLCADFDPNNITNAYIEGQSQNIFQPLWDPVDAASVDVGSDCYSGTGCLRLGTTAVGTPTLEYAEEYTTNGALTKAGSTFSFTYHVRFLDDVTPTTAGSLQLAVLDLLPPDGGAGFATAYEIDTTGGELWESTYAYSVNSKEKLHPVVPPYKPPTNAWALMELDVTLSDSASGPKADVRLTADGKIIYRAQLDGVSPTAVPSLTLGMLASGAYTPPARVEYDDVILNVK